MKHVTSIENSLTSLGRLNHHLADEVAKLPEIRKFRTESSRLALSNLLKIYRFSPDGFDRMFDAMDKIGMPAYRKGNHRQKMGRVFPTTIPLRIDGFTWKMV